MKCFWRIFILHMFKVVNLNASHNFSQSLNQLMDIERINFTNDKATEHTLLFIQHSCKVLADITGHENGMCPYMFDGIFCWKPVAAGSNATVPCPSYTQSHVYTGEFAARECNQNANWTVGESVHRDKDLTYSHCWPNNHSHDSSLTENYRRAVIIKISSIPGYILSSLSLTVAIIIFIVVKRLHCTRNFLHLHLFLAFLMRCVMCLLVSFDTSIESNTLVGRFACRLYATLFNYSIFCGWMWLLAVGLYMFNLIHRTVFGTQKLIYYVILGWGGSAVCLFPWIIVKLFFDTNRCWLSSGKPYRNIIMWLQRTPQLIVILINLCLFFIMTCDIYKKLRDSHIADTKRLRTLARSSLILLIMFGVPYCITSPLNIFIVNPFEPEGIRDWIIMGSEHFLGSIMGFFISIIFCFNNSEVRGEIRRMVVKFHQNKAPKKIQSRSKDCACRSRSRSKDSFTRIQDDSSLTTQTYVFRHKGLRISATVPCDNLDLVDVPVDVRRSRKSSSRTSHKRKESSRRSSSNSKTLSSSPSASTSCYLCEKDNEALAPCSGSHTECSTVVNSAQSTLTKGGQSVRFHVNEQVYKSKRSTSSRSSASNLSSDWNESMADVSL